MRRYVLLMTVLFVSLLMSAHGYRNAVNVTDSNAGDPVLTDPTPTPTAPSPTTPTPTTPTPTPTTPEPTTKTPAPPPPTTHTPTPTSPPTTAPTSAPPTSAPPTTAPPTAPPSTTSPPTTAPSTTTPSTTTPSTTTPTTTAPKTTTPPTTPTPTQTNSAAGHANGGRADDTTTSRSSSSGGKYAIIVAVVVVLAVVLIAGIYVLRRNRSKKDQVSAELRRQLDDLHMELGEGAYTMADSSDDVVVAGNSGSGNSDRGSYSRSSLPFQKSQKSPASWSSSRATAVSSNNDRDSLSGLWKDPELLAARIPYEKIQFQQLLSRGGFGEVYEGMYHNHRVAIKQLLPENRRRMAALEDFLKEAQLLTTLEHERIVTFMGVAWDSPRDLCIVLEFLPNGDLRNLLSEWREEGRKTGWDDVRKVRIALHVAEALTYLHTLSPKIVHRDLKSKNILLDAQWQAKLSDFGISRKESTHNTMTTNVGSSLWIAPEVMMGNNYDEKADIFSFGIVLTELDSHQLPYHSAMTPDGRKMPDAAILHLVTMGKLQAEFNPMSRTDMVLLGRSCLSMDPAQRPSAAELRFRLSQILGSY